MTNPPEDRGSEWKNLPLREPSTRRSSGRSTAAGSLRGAGRFLPQPFNVFRNTEGVRRASCTTIAMSFEPTRWALPQAARRRRHPVPAMLFDLDNNSNQLLVRMKLRRELFELHTMGAGTIWCARPAQDQGLRRTQFDWLCHNDVYEAARAFTGWRVDTARAETTACTTAAHSSTTSSARSLQQEVLGGTCSTIKAIWRMAARSADILAAHQGTARQSR